MTRFFAKGVSVIVSVVLVLGNATGVEGQMCGSSLQPAYSTLVAVGFTESATWPTAAVRREIGEIWWAELVAGGTIPGESFTTSGADANGPYAGVVTTRFRGIEAGGGGSIAVSQVVLCSSVHLTYAKQHSAALDKYYYNAFGQTIGYEEESLSNPSATQWRGRAEIAADYLLTSDMALGVGLFGARSSQESPDFPAPAFNEIGFGVGVGVMVWRGLWLEARYNDPFWDDSELSGRDAWFTGRVGWVF